MLFVVIGARFPDIDTLWSIDHHGLTHILVGIFITSVLLGSVMVGFAVVYRQGIGSDDSISMDSVDLFLTSSIALFLGQFSHILLDLISGPIPGEPNLLNPLWPVLEYEVTWQLVLVRSVLWNYGLLLVGCLVLVVVYTRVHREYVVPRLRRIVAQ